MIALQSLSGRTGPETHRGRVALAAAGVAGYGGFFADARIRRAIALANAYAEAQVPVAEVVSALGGVERAAAEARVRAAAPVWTIVEGRRAAAAVREARAAEEVAEVLGGALDSGGCFAAVPPVLDPAWLTSDAVGIAGAIVRDGPGDLLPILADALEDAGCVDPAILLHCRGAEPHARDCWIARRILESAAIPEEGA